MKPQRSLCSLGSLCVCVLAAGMPVLLGDPRPAAGVTIDTVVVGNAGNAADTAAHSNNPAGQGAVSYTYAIGKYEVTAGQYREFLNAVAATDAYGLCNTSMDDVGSQYAGCGIVRSGSSGSYTYSVAADWANRPVCYVSWGDAARFANWLHNGQPTGPQDLTTTESGSYVALSTRAWAIARASYQRPAVVIFRHSPQLLDTLRRRSKTARGGGGPCASSPMCAKRPIPPGIGRPLPSKRRSGVSPRPTASR